MFESSVKSRLRAWKAAVKTDFLHLASYRLNFFGGIITGLIIILWITFAAIAFSDKGSIYETTLPSVILYGTLVFFYASDFLWAVGRYVRRQQFFGTLEQIYMAPENMKTVMIMGSMGRAFISTVQALLVLVIFALFFPISIGNVFLAVIILGGVIIASLSVSIIMGAFTLTIKRGDVLMNFSNFAVIFLSAAFFPFAFLPLGIRYLSLLFPISYGVDAIRATMIPAWNPELMALFPISFASKWQALTTEIAILYVYSTLLLWLALKTFSWQERKLLNGPGLSEY